MSAIATVTSAAAALRDSQWPVLRQLVVIESDEEVIISGDVTSYYHKQLAQEVVRPALNSRKLRNLVSVQGNK